MNDCWITPEGKIIEVLKMGHNLFASNLLKEEKGLEAMLDTKKYPYEILHKRGWIRVEVLDYDPYVRVLGNCIDSTNPMRNTIDPPMNKIQMRIAKMICEEHDASFYKALNDKRFW